MNFPPAEHFIPLLEQEFFDSEGIPRQEFAAYFQNWQEIFSPLYSLTDGGSNLYLRHAYLILQYKWILENRNLAPDYSPVRNMFGWAEQKSWSSDKFDKYNLSCPDQARRQSGETYLDLISSQVRHAIGEIYTPSELATFVLSHALETKPIEEWKVLDPACGAGIFLLKFLEIVLKTNEMDPSEFAKCVENLVGFDVNPIAVFTTKANLQLFLNDRDLPVPDSFNIFLKDPLLENSPEQTFHQFTHIIGNPPWYNLGAVQTRAYQERLKSQARDLGIFPVKSANIPNIEVASLFLRQMTRDYLAPGGLISFLMPRNLIKGSQNGRVRLFPGLDNVEIWDFGQVSIFTVEFVALFAHETSRLQKTRVDDFNITYHRVESTKSEVTAPWTFTLGPQQIYSPVFVDLVKENAGRFVPQEILTAIPPLSESPYMSKFHNGARLGPRNLLFVGSEILNPEEARIWPDPAEVETCRGQWKCLPYETAIVHPANVFKCVMSKNLVPFYVMAEKEIFLPINNDLQYSTEELDPRSRDHFSQMSEVYLRLKKRDARQETLWEYITYNGKTTNRLQTRPLKVIYNSIGRKRVKAAILRNFIIADDSLYYYAPTTEEEAYYLAAILNSNILSFTVVNIKDERNIHKNPWRLPIPLWEGEKTQRDIALIGKSMEQKIWASIGDTPQLTSKRALEAQILTWIIPELSQLDEILQGLFGMS
ncbi:MAG TPA: N-6 DNA methylase [Candidatus Lokiarchaeia archaeon]|nr:N-6 DNA methylase [Candidatus Lokiarchaeia archaeon]